MTIPNQPQNDDCERLSPELLEMIRKGPQWTEEEKRVIVAKESREIAMKVRKALQEDDPEDE